jgi:AraC-like DNA-binding protein
MRYRELPPAPALRGSVRCFWVLEDVHGSLGSERILPDGCAELIVHHGAPLLREDGAHRRSRQPETLVSGQLRTATRLHATGAFGLFGVRFETWAAGPFLRDSLAPLTGASAPLDAFWGADARRLHERLAEAVDDEERAAIASDVLLARLAPADATTRALAAATRWIAGARGAIAVEDLARRLAWSRRRLERRFARSVGLAPKTLCRIARFQYAISQLGTDGRPRLARVAAQAGYADQAHFARDFRDLAGLPVTQWLAEHHALSDAFTGARSSAAAGDA